MNKKILFIEDEAALQKTLGEFLKQQGYELISALNGEIGVNLAKKEQPAIILLDLILPKVNGFEVLKTLKSDASTKQIPVLVLTNLGELENIEKVLSLGAIGYFVKANYTLKEVVEKIEQTLKQ